MQKKQKTKTRVKTNQWLKSAWLKAETEGLIIAAQDQNLSTRNYQGNIVKIDYTEYADWANKKLTQLAT